MPLDQQVRRLLDQLQSLRAPALCTLEPQLARAGMAAASAALSVAEPVGAKFDARAPGPAGEIPVRVYQPRGIGPWPVLVYYHGGGWVLGDIATHDAFCCALTNAAGCILVSVDYRLAPEHKYPAAVDDAFAAAEWVGRHAASLAGDPARVAVGGDSAGANLAAVVALKARDQRARDESDLRPVFQVLIYPITDHGFDTPSYRENAEGYMLTRDDMRWFWRHYLAREEDGRQPYASPLRAADLSDLPPALVITAEYDPLRDEGEAYAQRLCEAGVPVTLTRYDGMIHGFVRRLEVFDRAKTAVDEIAAAMNRVFARAA